MKGNEVFMAEKKKKKVYYQFETSNISFLKMHKILKDLGITGKGNKFFLKLYDKDLIGVDPYDETLSLEMQTKIALEVEKNFWYFIREIVLVPVAGGLKKFEIHRGNLAMLWCLMKNLNSYLELPRQNYKTQSAVAFYLHAYDFRTVNSEFAFLNKFYGDSKNNLKRLKDMRETLPWYLQMEDLSKDKNNLTYIESKETKNTIIAKPTAIDETAADLLGRGCTQPLQWYDEFAFLKYNDIIFASATPANSQAMMEAKNNKKPYSRLFTSTPGDLRTGAGKFAKEFINNMCTFDEKMYEWNNTEISEYIHRNSKNNTIYIKFHYYQIGRSQEWFETQCRELNYDWAKINREILLHWSNSSELSPFSEPEIARLNKHVKPPIATIWIKKFYPFHIYRDFSWKSNLMIGMDCSGGYDRDFTAITVVDPSNMEVVADFRNNIIDTVEQAEIVYDLLKNFFTNSVFIPERNSYGKSVIDILLKTDVAKSIYYENRVTSAEKKVKDVKKQTARGKTTTRVYGVNTDGSTRPKMIDLLRHIIAEEYDKINSKDIIDDISGLERKKTGKIEHGDITFDDSLFSYLMIRYVYAFGTNLSNFFIYKKKKDSLSPERREETEETHDTFLSKFASVTMLNKAGFNLSETEKMFEEFNKKMNRPSEIDEEEDRRKSVLGGIFTLNR